MRLIALALLLSGLALPVPAQDMADLRVTGRGTVEAVPDMAVLTLGVAHEAETAAAAMERVSADLAAVMDRLKAAGIEDRDLQTSGLDLSPVWTDREAGRRQEIIGFRAANMLSVRVRGLDGLGEVLDGVIAAGANTFQGLGFGLQEPEPVLDAARRAAVADALRKAALYAEAAGLTLGPVRSLSDEGGPVPRPMTMDAAPRMAAEAVPVAPGEVTFSASVTMVFALED